MTGRLELMGAVALLAATLVYAIEPERVVISGDDAVPVHMAEPAKLTVPTSVSTLSYATTSSTTIPVYTPCFSTGVTTVSASGNMCTSVVPMSR